ARSTRGSIRSAGCPRCRCASNGPGGRRAATYGGRQAARTRRMPAVFAGEQLAAYRASEVSMFRSIAAVCLTAILAVPVSGQSNMAKPEKFTAFAVNVSNLTPAAQTSPVDLTINRWSTDAERDRLRGILHDKGQDALLGALQKLPVVGYIT